MSKIGSGNQSWLGQSSYTGTTTLSSSVWSQSTSWATGYQQWYWCVDECCLKLSFRWFLGRLGISRQSSGRRNESVGSCFSLIIDRSSFHLVWDGGHFIQHCNEQQCDCMEQHWGDCSWHCWSTGSCLHGTSTGDNTFNPQLTDSGTGANITSVSKTGAGQWNFGNASNSYTGLTTIADGILALNSNGAFADKQSRCDRERYNYWYASNEWGFRPKFGSDGYSGSGTVTFSATTGGGGFAAHTTPLTVSIGGVGTPNRLDVGKWWIRSYRFVAFFWLGECLIGCDLRKRN